MTTPASTVGQGLEGTNEQKRAGRDIAQWMSLFVAIVAPVGAAILAYTLMKHSDEGALSLLNVRFWPAVDVESRGVYVLNGLLVCSIVVLFLNTALYGLDSWKKRDGLVNFLYLVAMVVIVLWFGEVVWGWGAGRLRETYPDFVKHLQDLYALLVFVLFAAMDWCLWQRCMRSTEQRNVDKARAIREGEVYRRQLWMVDIPVIGGILALNVFLHGLLEHSQTIGSDHEKLIFLTGLGAGALIMQVAFSQIVFLVVYLEQNLRQGSKAAAS